MTKTYSYDKNSDCYSLIINENRKCIASFYAHLGRSRDLQCLHYNFYGDYLTSSTILLRDFVNDLNNFILTGHIDPKDSGNPIFE